MNPFEIERMQWEEGDTIAGLLLEGDPKVGTGAFRLVCDGMEPPELETEDFEAMTAPAPGRRLHAPYVDRLFPAQRAARPTTAAAVPQRKPARRRPRKAPRQADYPPSSARPKARPNKSPSRPAAQIATRASLSETSPSRTRPSSTETCASRTSWSRLRSRSSATRRSAAIRSRRSSSPFSAID